MSRPSIFVNGQDSSQNYKIPEDFSEDSKSAASITSNESEHKNIAGIKKSKSFSFGEESKSLGSRR